MCLVTWRRPAPLSSMASAMFSTATSGLPHPRMLTLILLCRWLSSFLHWSPSHLHAPMRCALDEWLSTSAHGCTLAGVPLGSPSTSSTPRLQPRRSVTHRPSPPRRWRPPVLIRNCNGCSDPLPSRHAASHHAPRQILNFVVNFAYVPSSYAYLLNLSVPRPIRFCWMM